MYSTFFLLNLPSRAHDWPLPRSQHSAPDPRQHLKFHRATGHWWALGKLFMYNMYALYYWETPVHAKISIVYNHWGAKGLVSKQQPTARKNGLGSPSWSKWVDFIPRMVGAGIAKSRSGSPQMFSGDDPPGVWLVALWCVDLGLNAQINRLKSLNQS